MQLLWRPISPFKNSLKDNLMIFCARILSLAFVFFATFFLSFIAAFAIQNPSLAALFGLLFVFYFYSIKSSHRGKENESALKSHRHFDFMGNRYGFHVFSGALMIIAFSLILVKGVNFGVSFKGGTTIHVHSINQLTETKIREVFEKVPNLYFSPNQVIIKPPAVPDDKAFIIQYPPPLVETQETSQIHSAILQQLRVAAIETTNVDPSVEIELRRQSVILAFISIIGILLYFACQLEFQSAAGAILSIVHDLIIIFGFISLTGMEFDVTVLAALLTMLGYSVNAEITVLDRIREERSLQKNNSLSEIINYSVNATLAQRINGSLTTILTLIVLLLFGGVNTRNFAVTLILGIVFCNYSSIFITCPWLLHMTPNGQKI